MRVIWFAYLAYDYFMTSSLSFVWWEYIHLLQLTFSKAWSSVVFGRLLCNTKLLTLFSTKQYQLQAKLENKMWWQQLIQKNRSVFTDEALQIEHFISLSELSSWVPSVPAPCSCPRISFSPAHLSSTCTPTASSQILCHLEQTAKMPLTSQQQGAGIDENTQAKIVHSSFTV